MKANEVPDALIRWTKGVMLPAAKVHTSRKIVAVAMLAAAVSGFRFVDPVDDPAKAFRWLCLGFGGIAFVWLAVLAIFPPKK